MDSQEQEVGDNPHIKRDLSRAFSLTISEDLHDGWNIFNHDGHIAPSSLFYDGYLTPKLLPDIREWLIENLQDDYVIRASTPEQGSVSSAVLYFFNEVDLIHFKLRWVG